MPIEVKMPRLSDTMEVGTVVKWNVKPGQKVNSGDVIADIETDKAIMELEAYEDGVLERILVGEGESARTIWIHVPDQRRYLPLEEYTPLFRRYEHEVRIARIYVEPARHPEARRIVGLPLDP